MRDNMTKNLFEAVSKVNKGTYELEKEVLEESQRVLEADDSNREASNKSELRFCPRCGHKYAGYPAISRYDNKTEICPDCGVSEAMLNYLGVKADSPNRHSEKEISESADNEVSLEDKIAELRIALEDGSMSKDEEEKVKEEIAKLEKELEECDKHLKESDLSGKREDIIKGIIDILKDVDYGYEEFIEDLYNVAGENAEFLDIIFSSLLDSYSERIDECDKSLKEDDSDSENIDNEKSDESIPEPDEKLLDSDNIEDIIKFLIDDENKAIEGYNKARERVSSILSEDEVEKYSKLFDHIIGEEGEHIDELTKTLNGEPVNLDHDKVIDEQSLKEDDDYSLDNDFIADIQNILGQAMEDIDEAVNEVKGRIESLDDGVLEDILMREVYSFEKNGDRDLDILLSSLMNAYDEYIASNQEE